jgi:hypothetical protein
MENASLAIHPSFILAESAAAPAQLPPSTQPSRPVACAGLPRDDSGEEGSRQNPSPLTLTFTILPRRPARRHCISL